MISPQHLTFIGETSESGELTIHFDRRVHYDDHFELALRQATFFTDNMHNIKKDQYLVGYSDEKVTDVRPLPPTKCATFSDLCNAINALGFGFLLQTNSERASVLHCDNAIFTFPKRLGYSLGICTKDGQISKLLKKVNPDVSIDFNEDGEIEISTVSKSAKTVLLPRKSDDFIWNHVSEHSFQVIWLSCEHIQDHYVSSQLATTFALVDMDPRLEVLESSPYQREWHRIKEFKTAYFSIKLTDSTGTPLQKVRATVSLETRRRRLR